MTITLTITIAVAVLATLAAYQLGRTRAACTLHNEMKSAMPDELGAFFDAVTYSSLVILVGPDPDKADGTATTTVLSDPDIDIDAVKAADAIRALADRVAAGERA